MTVNVSIRDTRDTSVLLCAKQLLAAALAGFDDDLSATRRRLSEVTHLLDSSCQPERLTLATLSREKVERLEAYIRDNLYRVIRITELATMIGFSRGKFCRSFKETFGVTAHGYITAQRVIAAARMMQETSMPLSAIAVSCGLYDQSHLCNVFRKTYRVSPSVWRKRQQASVQARRVERAVRPCVLSVTG